MKRTLSLLTMMALCGAGSGCGTLLTRGEGAFFGAYPLEAIVADGAMIAAMFEPDQEIWMLYGLASLPFDVVFDVAFLPIDLIAWSCGKDKNRSRARSRSESKSEQDSQLAR